MVWDLSDAREERISDDKIVTYNLSSFNTLQIHEIVFQVGNTSDKEQPVVIEKANTSDMASGSQNTFCVAVNLKRSLPAALSQGSSHFE